MRCGCHKGCSNSSFLVKVTPCIAPGSWTFTMCDGPALTLGDALCMLLLIATQVSEAGRGFSLITFFAFPSPTASGFGVTETAAFPIISAAFPPQPSHGDPLPLILPFFPSLSFLLSVLPTDCTAGSASKVCRRQTSLALSQGGWCQGAAGQHHAVPSA